MDIQPRCVVDCGRCIKETNERIKKCTIKMLNKMSYEMAIVTRREVPLSHSSQLNINSSQLVPTLLGF